MFNLKVRSSQMSGVFTWTALTNSKMKQTFGHLIFLVTFPPVTQINLKQKTTTSMKLYAFFLPCVLSVLQQFGSYLDQYFFYFLEMVLFVIF